MPSTSTSELIKSLHTDTSELLKESGFLINSKERLEQLRQKVANSKEEVQQQMDSVSAELSAVKHKKKIVEYMFYSTVIIVILIAFLVGRLVRKHNVSQWRPS
ncbi:hypothetical protein P9112_000411 [Eukaryota sp. TZLM1-RC]